MAFVVVNFKYKALSMWPDSTNCEQAKLQRMRSISKNNGASVS